MWLFTGTTCKLSGPGPSRVLLIRFIALGQDPYQNNLRQNSLPPKRSENLGRIEDIKKNGKPMKSFQLNIYLLLNTYIAKLSYILFNQLSWPIS